MSCDLQNPDEASLTAECLRCANRQNTLLQLQCMHTFCITCITFMHAKFRLVTAGNNSVKCLQCGQISELEEELLALIKDQIKNVVIPFMANEEGNQDRVKDSLEKEFNTEVKDESSHLYSQPTAGKKVLKSFENSAEKVTPTNKYFYSKCQSPKHVNSDYCSLHPQDEVTFVCLTCNYSLLCIKCVSTRKHHSHEMKSIAKSIEVLNQQIIIGKLELKERVEDMELCQRRLQDRKGIIKDRWDCAAQDLKYSFTELVKKVARKADEIIEDCEEHFEELTQEAQKESAKISLRIGELKRYMDKLNEAVRNPCTAVHFVKKVSHTLKQINEESFKSLDVELLDKVPYPSSQIHQSLRRASEIIDTLHVDYNFACLSKTITVFAENCKSEDKIAKQNCFKRFKTNIISLNSSRDRKQKKCTRTEEDQRRNKSKAGCKQTSGAKLSKIKETPLQAHRDLPMQGSKTHKQSHPKQKQIPHYVLQHFEKSSIRPFENNFLCDSNILQSSFKSATKLSKTQIPMAHDENDKKKKKQHATMIKERLERKTVASHPNKERNGVDMIKRKKLQF